MQVADRFYVKPLLRSVTFPQAAYVLELAQGSARLLEIAPDAPPHEVALNGVRHDSGGDVKVGPGLSGNEGEKSRMSSTVRLNQYARLVDGAVRTAVGGSDLPLILAAAQPLDSVYRTVNSYPHLLEHGIQGNPEAVADHDLADEVRLLLDAYYAEQLQELRGQFEARGAQGRAATDLVDIARAATFGAVDTLFVDIDAQLPGQVDEESGEISYGDSIEETEPGEYGVVDEIASRVVLAHGRVLADDIPGGGAAAAILRYPV